MESNKIGSWLQLIANFGLGFAMTIYVPLLLYMNLTTCPGRRDLAGSTSSSWCWRPLCISVSRVTLSMTRRCKCFLLELQTADRFFSLKSGIRPAGSLGLIRVESRSVQAACNSSTGSPNARARSSRVASSRGR